MSQSPIYLDINNNKSVITALKAGEEKVFDVVYRHYFRRLCAFCSQYVSEQEEIEEIVQEDRKSTRLNSSHREKSRMPSSA